MLLIALTLTFILSTRGAPIGDLYLPDDDVEILTVYNFKELVENSTTAWLVEFYASWCGYCQRFAPPWKEFATEAASWRDMVRVGVLECSDELNIPICRDFGIAKYPTVRYFPENYRATPEDLGVVVPHGNTNTVDTVKQSVLGTFISEQNEGRGSVFPDLKPYVHRDVSEVFAGVPEDVKHVFLVVEDNDRFLGADVYLDLHRTPNLVIKFALHNNSELVSTLKIDSYPFVVAVDRNNNQEVLKDVNNRKGIKAAISSFLDNQGIKTVEIILPKIQNSSVDPDPDSHSRTVLRQYVKKMGDVVFQRDLEAALRYSLQQEVATIKVLKDSQLEALNSYIRVIKKYFPFGHNSTVFIDNLVNLTTGVQELEGSQLQLLVEDAEKKRVFSSPQRFLGCLGSSSRYRGYPCSLWRMFHYLTVNSLLYNTNNKKANPREVLDAMHGYVKNFFSCSHCANHFQQMARERNMTSVESLEESVFWLWEAHNVVNARLHDDPTEDPEYVKEQFPTKLRCPECYKEDGSWEKREVLKYLKRMYGWFNVRYIGSDTTVLFPGLK